MTSAKRFLMVAGAFVVATLTFTLANPKAVHAFAATLVQVVNSASSPIPVQPIPARQAVSLVCFINVADGNTGGQGSCLDPAGNTFTVPAGKRLVLESSSGFCNLPGGQHLLFPQIAASNGETVVGFHIEFQGTRDGTDFYHLSQDGVIYVDPGVSLSAFINRNVQLGAAACTFDSSGHLEDIQ